MQRATSEALRAAIVKVGGTDSWQMQTAKSCLEIEILINTIILEYNNIDWEIIITMKCSRVQNPLTTNERC
jgi:hypothetical protein